MHFAVHHIIKPSPQAVIWIQRSLIRVLNCPMIVPQRLLNCPVNLVSNPMNCLVRLIDYIVLAIFDALTP